MTAEVAKQITGFYLDHLAQVIDTGTFTEVHPGIDDSRLQMPPYQIFEAKYKNDPQSLAVFVFAYLNQPDELIAHKLMNLTNELAWLYSQKDLPALPAIFPVVLYDSPDEWVPKNIKELYTVSDNIPDFFFEFIDLQRSFVQTV